MTAASCIPWALVPVFALLWKTLGIPLFVLTPHLGIIGALLFAHVWRRKPRPILEPVHVATDASSLLIDDERIPRDAIKRAELLPNVNNAIVRIALKGQLDEDLVVDDDERAHELLKKLGFDPSQTTARYRIGSLALARYRFAPLAILPFIFLGGMLGKTIFPAVMPLILIAFAALFLAPASLVVGVDGLLVKWLWTREFIPAKDIIMVRRYDTGMGRNRSRGIEVGVPGRTIKLPLAAEETAQMAIQRIRDALALAHGTAHVEDDALLLARGDLDLRGWINRLKALGSGATATLRTPAVMPEQLWRVAEDPAQPAIQRAAAAIALTPSLAETDKLRLADVAKTTAEPKLRVALERAAEDAPDEQIEEALRQLTADS